MTSSLQKRFIATVLLLSCPAIAPASEPRSHVLVAGNTVGPRVAIPYEIACCASMEDRAHGTAARRSSGIGLPVASQMP